MDKWTPEQMDAWMKEVARLGALYQIYYPVAFWVEAILYGLYCSMFVSTMRIMLNKRPAGTATSKVFLIVTVLIFLCATAHNITAISRLIRAYALLLAPPAPYLYFQNFKYWDNYAHLILLAFCTWLGDILVIYRCFLIWRRSKRVILLPVILLIGSIGTTFVNWHWFQHPEAFLPEQITPVLFITFPLNLAQNVLTTSLIAWKIYKQHRETVASGLQITAGLNLVGVIRIIVESAMVYTVEMALIIVLFSLNNPAVVIVQHALPPTIGMVFCLIAIRTHVARTDSIARPDLEPRDMMISSSDAFFPTWITTAAEHDPFHPPPPLSPPDAAHGFNYPSRGGSTGQEPNPFHQDPSQHQQQHHRLRSYGRSSRRGSDHAWRNGASVHPLGPIKVTTVTERYRHSLDASSMSTSHMSRMSKREFELEIEREARAAERERQQRKRGPRGWGQDVSFASFGTFGMGRRGGSRERGDGDGDTLDVDLDDDLEVKSPGSVRTFEVDSRM